MKVPWLLILLVGIGANGRAPKLNYYNVDTSQITVSGISSGGFFAVQFHVAHSKVIRGVGAIAAGPFWCAQDNLATALGACENKPDKISVPRLVAVTRASAATYVVDSTEHLKKAQVYLISGALDSVVLQGVVKKLNEYYSEFVTDGNVSTLFSLQAQHCFPTEGYGNACPHLGSPYICDCNFSAAHEILNHVYPGSPHNLKPSYQSQNLFEFDQSEFLIDDLTSMDSTGYIYVPTACQSMKTPCKLHIVFHGCLQGKMYLQDQFAAHAGYGDYAEGLQTIVLFPQVINSTLNPKGCWDWWGYTSPSYASKLGLQTTSIRNMLERVARI